MQLTGLFDFRSEKEQLPMIRQSEITECGIACVAMMAGYFGDQQSMHSLRRRFGANLSGVTLYEMAQFASELGMQASPCQIDLPEGASIEQTVIEQLGDLGVPVVLHWDANHFVVLNTLRMERNIAPDTPGFGQKMWIATIHDPARGIVKYPIKEMLKHFTGYVMLCEPMPSFDAGDHRERIGFRDLWSKIRGFKKTISLIIGLSMVLQCILMITPYFLQTVLDNVLVSEDHQLLLVLAIGFGGLVFFERAVALIRGFSLTIFNQLFSVQLKTGLYRHLLRLPMNFFESRSVGDTLSRFHSLSRIQDLMVNGLVAVTLDGVMSVMVLGLMFFYSPLLTGVVLGLLSVYLLIQWMSMEKNREFIEKVIHKEASIQSQQIETLRAMQTLKLFNAQAAREQKWAHEMTDLTRTSIAQSNFKEIINQCAALVKGLMHVIVVYMGAQLVMAGHFSVGMFLAFLSYRTMLADSLTNLIGKFVEFKLLDVHFERVSDVVCSGVEDGGPAPSSADPVIQGKISLRQVSFHYGVGSARKQVVNNLSLEVLPGESVAIIGPSGAGKTTVMKLLVGALTPEQGEVLVDDIPLTTFGLRKFREQIATVMQDDSLLSGTILENVVFFAPRYDMEWAIACAKAACVYDDIMAMPMNWQSLVGDMGSMLSGGQKQRLLLARALYKRPRIIFLDEATSHLDIQREASINEAITGMSITRVIIAHRKETIASAGRVLVIGGERGD